MGLKELNSFFVDNDESLHDRVIEGLKNLVVLDRRSLIDQIYSIYENILIKENNLGKEIFFVEVLTLLSDSLIHYDSLTVFVKRYIKCSVDTAGFDLKLCSLSRKFLLSLAKHKKQADILLSYLISIFVGKIDISNDGSEERDSQVYEEHQRFIRSNCENLIIEVVNLSEIKLFFKNLNEHMISKGERLRSLDLLSSVLVFHTNEDVKTVLETDLMKTLINCLYYDESIVELNSATECLTLILPYIVEIIPLNLGKLYLIYLRLVSLTLDPDDDVTPRSEIGNPLESVWESVSSLEGENLMELDYAKLFLYLYGLFPLNLVKFFKESNFYFDQLDKSLTNILLQSNRYDFFEVKAISQQLFEKLKFHRNFILFASADEELNDVLRWKQIGNHNDIAKMCMDYLIKDYVLMNRTSSETKDDSVELTQLMQTHKELYTSRNSITSSDSGDELSNIELLNEPRNVPSSNLEFYRRELLLIRNDLKFTTYLKDLNELKLNEVLQLYRNEVKNHKLQEGSMLNLRILNNKNQLLTKNIEQLKDEYKRFKNNRLEYEVLILDKNKALRKINDESKLEIKNLQSVNEELQNEINSIKKLVHPKDIEINDLKLKLASLNAEITRWERKMEQSKHNEESLLADDFTHPYVPTSVADIQVLER